MRAGGMATSAAADLERGYQVVGLQGSALFLGIAPLLLRLGLLTKGQASEAGFLTLTFLWSRPSL